MTRFSVTVLLPALLLLSCSGGHECPAGSERVGGKCQLVDPGQTADFVLPTGADTATPSLDAIPSDATDLPGELVAPEELVTDDAGMLPDAGQSPDAGTLVDADNSTDSTKELLYEESHSDQP